MVAVAAPRANLLPPPVLTENTEDAGTRVWFKIVGQREGARFYHEAAKFTKVTMGLIVGQRRASWGVDAARHPIILFKRREHEIPVSEMPAFPVMGFIPTKSLTIPSCPS
jgi:hypothetical protein